MNLRNLTPEEKNISSSLIINFNERIQKAGISLHSTLLYADDSIISEVYFAPFKKGELHRMFSVAKSVIAIGIGLLCDEGRISLDDSIVKYFPEKLPKEVHPYLAQLTIRDMLMMRTCHAKTTYDKYDLTSNWVGSYFTTTPTHAPGTVFNYDTSAPHVLSALIEKLTGRETWNYIRDSLPALGLSRESYMIKDRQGVSFGGSGLVATDEDLLRLGIFFMNEGCIDGTQLINKAFCKDAVSRLTSDCVASHLPSDNCGYGYYVWTTGRDGYLLYGMGGQLVIICPEKRIILATTANTQGFKGGNRIIYDAFYEEIIDKIGTVSIDARDYEALKTYSANARMNTVLSTVEGAYVPGKDDYKDVVYALSDNDRGYKALRFRLTEDGGVLTLETEKGQKQEFTFGYGVNKKGTLPLYGDTTYASGAYSEENTFLITLHIIGERVGSVNFKIDFKGDKIYIADSKIEETCFNEFNMNLSGALTN